MSMSGNRWHVIAESNFPWEREALEWLRAHLPDREPWNVWTNFEFIDDEGKISEVDALVLSPAGLFLVEIKSIKSDIRPEAIVTKFTDDILKARNLKSPVGVVKALPASAYTGN